MLRYSIFRPEPSTNTYPCRSFCALVGDDESKQSLELKLFLYVFASKLQHPCDAGVCKSIAERQLIFQSEDVRRLLVPAGTKVLDLWLSRVSYGWIRNERKELKECKWKVFAILKDFTGFLIARKCPNRITSLYKGPIGQIMRRTESLQQQKSSEAQKRCLSLPPEGSRLGCFVK